MAQTANIYLVTFPGFELLDLAGPSSVFSMANFKLGKPAYQIVPLSTVGGAITSFEGVVTSTNALDSITVTKRDTVIVTGGLEEAIHKARFDRGLLNWLAEAGKQSARVASVCTGSFILAEAGLADNKTVATHWHACNQFRQDFPNVVLDDEAIYRRDGALWTSAGVTSGIDMALAMLEEDWGTEVKTYVSRALVVYAHRPGFQTQFSDLLQAQSKSRGSFDSTIAWINEHLAEAIRVEDLAEKMNMSERNFFRKFSEAFGVSPAKYIEMARLMKARDLLLTSMPLKQIVAAVGYRSDAAFRTAFERRFGTTPSGFREVHTSTSG